MSEVISVAGKVSGARVDTSISVNNTTTVNNYNSSSYGYAPSTTTSSQTVVNKTMTFRVDNHPANLSVSVNLTDGDLVTAAGLRKGELEVLAIHNHTTHMLYNVPKVNTVSPIIYIVIGVLTTGFYGIGFILIGGGIWYLMNAKKRNNQIAEAMALVKTAPVPGLK